MKLVHVSAVAGLTLGAGALQGCDRSPRGEAPRRPAAVQLDELPELDDPIGPLDDNRIEVAPPKGWHLPSRSSRWIIRFTPSQQARYPSIIVRAEDYQAIVTVAEDNVDEFAEQIAESFARDKSAASQRMTITPIELGNFTGVRYRRRGKASFGFKEIIVERLLLDTVVSGRRYTVELQAREGDLKDYEPYALAVAAGIKFTEPPSQEQSRQPDAGLEPEPSEDDGR